jgi:hypothetical protein
VVAIADPAVVGTHGDASFTADLVCLLGGTLERVKSPLAGTLGAEQTSVAFAHHQPYTGRLARATVGLFWINQRALTLIGSMAHDANATIDISAVLTALGEDTLSDKGLAERITGDTTSEARQKVCTVLFDLVESGVVNTYERCGVTWYEAAEAPLCPPPAPKADAGYADEDPGDGRPDRLYGN